ncbi:MAG: APC family permease [Mogibacterium sp.]|nr:APC family permease [Mogibacterium sp.]
MNQKSQQGNTQSPPAGGQGNPADAGKMGLVSSILLCLACIIGVGIFGTLPEEVRRLGPGIIYALICGAAVTILRSVSRMYTSAALPISAATVMHGAKLIHPLVGGLLSINAFMNTIGLAIFARIFPQYFLRIFPGLPLSETALGVVFLLFFGVLSWFGSRSNIIISNTMIALLICSFGIYIIGGLPHVSADYLSLRTALHPAVPVTEITASAGVLLSSFGGATAIAEVTDKVRNPGRTVPLAMLISPSIVLVLYMLLGIVTAGVVPQDQATSFGDVAATFLPNTLLVIFILVGPLLGSVSPVLPFTLSCMERIRYISKLGYLPAVFQRQNRHGVPTVCLFLTYGVGIVFVLSGIPFRKLLIFTALGYMVAEIPCTLTPIFAYRKYPHCCDNAPVRMNRRFVTTLAVLMTFVNVYLGAQMLVSLSKAQAIGFVAFFTVGFVLILARIRYLRGQGRDLIEEIKAPHPEWEARETALAAQAQKTALASQR